MKDVGTGFHALEDVADDGHGLVFHVHKVHSFFGNLRGGGCNGGHGVALEEGGAFGQQVLAEVPGLHGGLAADAGASVLQFGKVIAGDYGDDAGEGEGAGGVNLLDFCVGMRTAHHLGVQGASEGQVGREDGLAGDTLVGVDTRNTLAYDLKAVGVTITLSHYFTSCIILAAAWTDRRILS